MVYEGINSIEGLSCIRPKGALYAFINIQKTGLTSEEFAKRLIMEKQVCVVPGSGFGSAGEGFIRLCYATSDENIKNGLAKIKDFVALIMVSK